MIPQVELICGGGKVACIQISQHGGTGEGAGANVKDEINQRIEFVLVELNRNCLIDASCGSPTS